VIAAIHNAGHAVALIMLGFTGFSVDLGTGEAAESFTLAASPPPHHPLVARGVVIAAGPAAEVCYRRLRRVRPIGAADLRGELAQLQDNAFEVDVDDLHQAAGGKLDRHWQLLANIAQTLLLRRWPIVEAVAEALQRRRRLSAEEVAAVMAGDTPTLKHAEPDSDRLATTLAPRARTPRRRAASQA